MERQLFVTIGVRKMPVFLWRRFKALAALEGKSANQKLIEVIGKEVTPNEED